MLHHNTMRPPFFPIVIMGAILVPLSVILLVLPVRAMELSSALIKRRSHTTTREVMISNRPFQIESYCRLDVEFLVEKVFYVFNGKDIDPDLGKFANAEVDAAYVLPGSDAVKFIDYKFGVKDIAIIIITKKSKEGTIIKTRLQKAGFSSNPKIVKKIEEIIKQRQDDKVFDSERNYTKSVRSSRGYNDLPIFSFNSDFNENDLKRLQKLVAGKLIIVDNKESASDDLQRIPLKRFESIHFSIDTVLKAKYGHKADQGIVVITTKK